MAKDFLPKVITWFRLDEHVRRLKEFVDSLTTRVETLENASGGNAPTLQQVTTEGNTTDKDIISEHASQVRVIEVKQTITNAAAGLYATGLLKLRNVLGWTANLSGGNLTADRTFEFPDDTGTLVLDAPTDSQNYVRNDNTWVVAPSGGASELEKLNEGNGDGWRLLGRNAALFGNIGLGAIDFSDSDDLSSTRGATGAGCFASGLNNIVNGQYNAVLGGSANNITNAAYNSVILGGENNTVSGGYGVILGGVFNAVSGDRAVAAGFANTAYSYAEFVVGTCATTYVPVGTSSYWEDDRAFVVGTGAATNVRSDGFTVFKNSRSKFGGVAQLKNYTVGTLPVGVQGDTAYVTDATAPTYLGALVGGGAVKCPVFFNGTIWVSH